MAPKKQKPEAGWKPDYIPPGEPIPGPLRANWEVSKAGWRSNRALYRKRLTSKDEACWYPLPEVVCTYCQVKGQVETYKLSVSEEVELARRRRKGNYPNMRCSNCTSRWRDESLS